MRSMQRTLVSLVALAAAGVPLALGSSAEAAPTVEPCVDGHTASTQARMKPNGGAVPDWRQHADTGDVTKADLAALPAKETRRGFVKREVAPRLSTFVVIPVYAHVITGKHRGERARVSRARVRSLITVLNRGMEARQSSTSAWTRYRFTVKKIDYTRRDGWYHAYFNGPRDQRMKRKLHRGNARTLNLYLNGGGPAGQPVLGWSRFPWQYASAPKLDGISVNTQAIPGGKASGYNLGDTVIHETGHWLGLLHTFQGGCSEANDLVADTAAEDEPSYYCETTRDTCPAPGLDPVRNFMDYSLDACMNMFTPGQVRRMDSAFEKWRL
jgi:hypothetical protein